MAILKCKMCGAPLQVEEGTQIVQCRYCESAQTIPQLDDELKLKMFERATELRIKCDFEQAAIVFQNITMQFPEEAEAYWGLCLCKYGIEYVDDPVTLAKVPTCHRTQMQSILSDNNYLTACEYAGSAQWKYEEEAVAIDKIQKKILDISRSEEPYDVFICYKETDDSTGTRTDDSVTAQDIYTDLIEKNYRVFYSRVTLRGKAGGEYEPYIYAALSSAKVMLVLGSKKEYFNAVWLKNEWFRYLNMAQSEDKTIIPCFENMSATDLPVQLRGFQALDMGNKMFSSDLMKNIQRIIPKPQAQSIGTANHENMSAGASRKELDFEDGAYIGDALATRPHGFGTKYFTNGNKYEGNWQMGKMHGQGTFYYSNGDSWTGEWLDNMAKNGSGKYHVANNDCRICYEGTLKNGLLSGQGKMYFEGKIKREGHFEGGKLNGQGAYYINDQSCVGEFKDGFPWNATGTHNLRALKNAYFTGEWVEGQPNGAGTIKFIDGASMQGNFVNGINGRISYYFTDGRRYEGEIKNGVLSGQGKMFAKGGRLIYEGKFENNSANGYGVHYVDNVEKYEGEFKDDKYHGQGTYYFGRGWWTGEWKDGVRWNGQGLLMHCDKDGKRNGKFYSGHMEDGKASGKGVLKFADGSWFEGEFANDHYYNGTVYNAEKQVIDTYVNGESEKSKSAKKAKTALNIIKSLSGL